MRRITLCFVLVASNLGLVREASAQTRVRFEPGAWYDALSQEYHTSLVQVQVGKASEGPVVKAIFEDTVTAALPVERQEAAARLVARYIVASAAEEPALAAVIVGWRHRVDGIPTAQTFRFSVSEFGEGTPTATPQ